GLDWNSGQMKLKILLGAEGNFPMDPFYDQGVNHIIDEDGTLVYAGGIDDKPTANPADIKGATNFVRQAMAEMEAGKSVSVAKSRPYGCSVKYN
ncbi:MAG: hypothetical protein AAFU65_11880, partial [Pseudomonadota bacterium]